MAEGPGIELTGTDRLREVEARRTPAAAIAWGRRAYAEAGKEREALRTFED